MYLEQLSPQKQSVIENHSGNRNFPRFFPNPYKYLTVFFLAYAYNEPMFYVVCMPGGSHSAALKNECML